jgi:HNH endonuclease
MTARGFIKCYVCAQMVPDELSHDHHKIPRLAAGGDEPENRLKLCSSCHNNTHRIAELIKSGKAGIANDISRAAYPDLQVRERLFELVRLVAEAMILKADGKVLVEETVLSITLPMKTYTQIRLIANEHINPVTGRSMGVDPYVRNLIAGHVKQILKEGDTPPKKRSSVSLKQHPLAKFTK